jgi:hypothetical protein
MARPKAVMHPVAVLATKDATGNYHFRPESDLWNHGGQEFLFHKDKHGMTNEDFHLVEFVLDDRTGDGLRFPSRPHDAMWVTAVEDRSNAVCPDKDSVSDYSVMEPICVCDDGKRLIVRNDNPRKEDWAFTMNVVGRGDDESDASKYVSWDPIGSNQNGGTHG